MRQIILITTDSPIVVNKMRDIARADPKVVTHVMLPRLITDKDGRIDTRKEKLGYKITIEDDGSAIMEKI